MPSWNEDRVALGWCAVCHRLSVYRTGMRAKRCNNIRRGQPVLCYGNPQPLNLFLQNELAEALTAAFMIGGMEAAQAVWDSYEGEKEKTPHRA